MPVQIVFVDDSKSILKTIEILLKSRVQNGEIEIRTFSKAVDFLEAIESNSIEFSVLFLDINMPVLSGYDLLKMVRRARNTNTSRSLRLPPRVQKRHWTRGNPSDLMIGL